MSGGAAGAGAGTMTEGQGTADRASARDRILAAAVGIVARDGEAALRLADVAAEAGVALSLTTHYFRTRDHLVAEALAARFAGLVRDDLRRVAASVDAGDAAAFWSGVRRLTGEVLDRGRAPQRLMRLATIGGAHGRPDLAARLGEELTALLDEFGAVLAAAQARGYIRADVDARALATFIHAYTLGMVAADLDVRPSDIADVLAVADRFFDAMGANG
jgi:AcrR family transcriptional regulator